MTSFVILFFTLFIIGINTAIQTHNKLQKKKKTQENEPLKR